MDVHIHSVPESFRTITKNCIKKIPKNSKQYFLFKIIFLYFDTTVGMILKSFHAFGKCGFWNSLQPPCHIFLDFLCWGVMVPLQLQFKFGELEVVGGTHIWWIWWMGEDCDTLWGEKTLGNFSLYLSKIWNYFKYWS